MSHCDHDSTELADPAMDTCCARHQADEVKANAIIARLKAVDCSMARVSLASGVLGSVPDEATLELDTVGQQEEDEEDAGQHTDFQGKKLAKN